MKLRLEDGSAYDTGALLTNAPRWTWERLDDGTEVLLGPAASFTPLQTLDIRIAAGDPQLLQLGTLPR